MPQVREQLTAQTGIALNYSTDPTTSVAVGAAYYAANKYYEPAAVAIIGQEEKIANDILASVDFDPVDIQIDVNYSRSSRDKEEVLLISSSGDIDDKTYRITRADGGFDTGHVTLKSKKTEFLQLIPGMNNLFTLSVYDSNSNEIKSLTKEIAITQGMYNIDGQPLPT
ncbi:MAG: hypothetical protein WDM90_05250 [Ferruginibacter sp.]